MSSLSRRLGVGLALVVAVVAPPVMVSAQGNDLAILVGKWKVNMAKSKYDPGPAPQSTVRTIEDWGGGLMHVVNDTIDAKGVASGTHFVARYDGRDYPSANVNQTTRNTISYRRIDANTVEYTSKSDGKVTTTTTRTVSKDGKTMTERAKGTNLQGQPVNNLLVYDKL